MRHPRTLGAPKMQGLYLAVEVRSFAVPSLFTTSFEGAGTASELGISADTLGVLTSTVRGREQEARSKLFRLGCAVFSIVLLGSL